MTRSRDKRINTRWFVSGRQYQDRAVADGL